MVLLLPVKISMKPYVVCFVKNDFLLRILCECQLLSHKCRRLSMTCFQFKALQLMHVSSCITNKNKSSCNTLRPMSTSESNGSTL